MREIDKTFANKFRSLRREKGLTQEQLLIGFNSKYHRAFTPSAISQYENGKRIPEIDALLDFANYFNVPVGYLLGNESNLKPLKEPLRGGQMIPVLGSVPAGIPIEAIEDIIDEIEIDLRLKNTGYDYFGLMVTGESMYPEYKDGDIVIVRKQETADNGDDVVAYINGYNATIKRIIISDKGITLRALNPVYETKTYSTDEVINLPVIILGIVVEQRRHRK